MTAGKSSPLHAIRSLFCLLWRPPLSVWIEPDRIFRHVWGSSRCSRKTSKTECSPTSSNFISRGSEGWPNCTRRLVTGDKKRAQDKMSMWIQCSFHVDVRVLEAVCWGVGTPRLNDRTKVKSGEGQTNILSTTTTISQHLKCATSRCERAVRGVVEARPRSPPASDPQTPNSWEQMGQGAHSCNRTPQNKRPKLSAVTLCRKYAQNTNLNPFGLVWPTRELDKLSMREFSIFVFTALCFILPRCAVKFRSTGASRANHPWRVLLWKLLRPGVMTWKFSKCLLDWQSFVHQVFFVSKVRK